MQILTADYSLRSGMDILAESIHQTGFGILYNHPISKDLIDEVYETWQVFFQSKDKTQYDYQKHTSLHGYYPFQSENSKGYSQKNLMEYFMFYRWGELPTGINEKTTLLFDQLVDLARDIMRGLDAYTPDTYKAHWEMPLENMVNNQCRRNVLRVIHYPPLTGQEDKDAVRATPHEDIDLVTVLPAATSDGLAVQDREGNWHKVQVDPDTMIINAGDMLQMLSKGFYKSTTHQVDNPEGLLRQFSRLSMPMFVHPEDNIRLSNTHTAGEYLLERLKENGVVTGDSLPSV